MKIRIHQWILLVTFVFMAVPPMLCQGVGNPQQLSERIVAYEIDASLDVPAHSIRARETVTWKNTTRDRVNELQFHLYFNAFKNSETTLMKESGGNLRGTSTGPDDYGWTTITRMRTAAGMDLLPSSHFIQPDDANPADQTVLRVPLPQPVNPGESITVELDFEAKLPALLRRAGYVDDYFMVAQWFPKLGVYEASELPPPARGGWNCHQYHANTEFYADYGTFDVRLTMPVSFVVGATGMLMNESVHANGTKTQRYQANDVHDFAWTASPRYRIVEDSWRDVKIKLLTQEHRIGELSTRYIIATKMALEYFADWLMPYPYPVITVVDPEFGAFGAGGMEYPTLFTGGSMLGIPPGFRFTEMVTIHEFGHQYWYGMVGNNEFEEAWLDEGLNQYSETRIMDHGFGKSSSFVDCWGLKVGDFAFTRDGYVGMRSPSNSPIAVPVWKMAPGTYGSLSYNKTAVAIRTLEGIVGRETIDAIFRSFFQRWKFKHPKERDFRNSANEVVKARHGATFGENLDWFFDQVLDGSEVCDYEITKISSSLVSRPRGNLIGVLDTVGTHARQEKRLYDSRILISRRGGVRLPVEVLVRFSDGTAVTEKWDGQDRWREFRFVRPAGVSEAIVDPEGKIALDIDLVNNSKSIVPSSSGSWKVALKVLHWVQNTLMTAMMF